MPKAKKEQKEQTALLYKNIPLVKRGNLIVYGNLNDDVYVQMEIMGSDNFQGLDIANDVVVTLVENGRITKKTEKDGLFRALDIGVVWLEAALGTK